MMDEIGLRRKRRSPRSNARDGRVCASARRADRIEQRNNTRPRRTRRYAPARPLRRPRQSRRSDAENDVDAEPYAKKSQHARVAQRRISDSAGTRAAASASPRLNERKLPFTKQADRGAIVRHRRQSADHRRHRVLVGDEMRQRAGHGRHRHEGEEPDRPKRPPARCATAAATAR